jgi:gluconolactonase
MTKKLWIPAAGLLGLSAALLSQQPPPAGTRTTGPGIQAGSDAFYASVIATCKTPPPPRPAAAKAAGAPKAAPPKPAEPREVTITAIAGVVEAGAQWKEIWQVDGNNADGFIPDANGDLLIAQNDNSMVVRLTPDGKLSVAFTGTHTGGSLAMNKQGAIFVVNRGLMASIEQLAPKRQYLADRLPNGDPLDCLGGVLNDATADSKGGVYFTNGVVYYADKNGKVTRYGENIATNGIALSADERRLFVTNGPSLVVFDVRSDGSLTNQREFVRWETGGGDGMAFDTQGRLYVTVPAGVQVVSADGKLLGLIPTPRPPITVTFGGADRKTLYTITRDNAQNRDWILALPVLSQGARPRVK